MMHPALLTTLLLSIAAPAIAQEGAWTYRDDPEPVALSYVPPGLTDPSVIFTCVKDSRQLVALFPVEQRLGVEAVDGRWVDDVGRPAPWPVSVTIASAESRTTIPGVADIDPQGGGSIVSVEFADRAPVAEAFRQTGVISLAAVGGVVTPAPAPRRSVQSFLRYCR